MIDFVVAFLPLAIGMWLARVLIRGTRPNPADAGDATELPALPEPVVDPDPVLALDETVPPAWTALDDIQLERLLNESSS